MLRGPRPRNPPPPAPPPAWLGPGGVPVVGETVMDGRAAMGVVNSTAVAAPLLQDAEGQQQLVLAHGRHNK